MSKWSKKALGEVCQIKNGGTPRSKVESYWNGEVLWITPKDMGSLESRYVEDTPRKITEEGLKRSSAKLIPSNSVILSTRAPIGYLAINRVPMATNQGCRGVIPNDDLLAEYLYYFLKFNVQLLISLGGGATFNELSTKALASVEIPLPPLSEQKRLVAILDEAFEGIDRAKANVERNIANAQELFESYLNSILWEIREKATEHKLGDVCENLDSQRIPISKKDRVSGEIPYYGASGAVDWVKDSLFDEDLLLVSEDGANLLARSHPIAFSISGKSWVNNHAHVLRFDSLHSQKFVEYYLNSISLEPYVRGMAQPKINQKALNSIPVPYPSQEEQERVVNLLDEAYDNTGRLIKLYYKKLSNLEELRSSLLQKAFQGELSEEVHEEIAA